MRVQFCLMYLLCPFRPHKVRIFHVSSLLQATLATGFVSGCSFYLFSLALYFFNCEARPSTISSSSDLWYQNASPCPAPSCMVLCFAVEYPVAGTNEQQGYLGSGCLLPSIPFPILNNLFSSFYSFFLTRSVMFKNRSRVFLKVLFYIEQNQLF